MTVNSSDSEIPRITEAEVLRRIRREADLQGGIKPLAHFWGVDRSSLSRMLSGKRRLTESIVRCLKLKRVRFVIDRFEDVNAKGR